ncbi:pentatricopeptide repeat-containing protein At3g20730-like [Carica papaya]|uniref:pentatricopeptide repeat-containing protein At3g20730-like n=1 Tax=Carica papaya TaxID=3649 RepID=UPI000B8CB6A8|nr:pentatricopeptide repeat-containing protein At3g20730-like [Carica papaya]
MFHMPLLKCFVSTGESLDSFTLSSALRASIGGSGLTKVSQVHGLIIKLGFGAHSMLAGSLIDAYAKCGSIKSAYQLYKIMIEKDIISCTALIAAFARFGRYTKDAFDLFKEVKLMQMRLDDVILCSMLNICANAASLSVGRQIHAFTLKCQPSYDVATGNALIDMYAKSGEVEDATLAFNEMGERNVISWTSLIAGYGKHGYADKAIALYKKMECHGVKPNNVTFLSLLFGCSHTGLIGEGWKIFNTMVSKYNISPRAEHCSCIVDLFARGGQLELAYSLISEMNIKPSPSLWGSLLGACRIYGNMALGEVVGMHLLNIEPEKSATYAVVIPLAQTHTMIFIYLCKGGDVILNLAIFEGGKYLARKC